MDETGSGGGVCAPETGRRSGTSRRHKPKTRVRGAVQTTFASLQPQLLPSTLEVVASLGFTTLTPVQAATIPLFLTNKDVAVEVSSTPAHHQRRSTTQHQSLVVATAPVLTCCAGLLSARL